MDCEHALSILESYLDAELGGDAGREVEQHLAECRDCFSRGEFRSRVRELVRRKCGIAVEMPDSVAIRIRALLTSPPLD
ncbi:MAG TPA: zf-HC2 domain-containing protein [Actinomycetota bacterium]|nr:zf-HC2 domain-containing protein [Actinomycetota bacterium]